MWVAVGERTRLRPLGPGELAIVQSWDEDPEIVALMGKKFKQTADLEAWYEAGRRGLQQRALAIETHDGSLIGDVELEHINWRSRTAELRICIGVKKLWGKGFGQDAVRQTLTYAFGTLKLERVYLKVYASNTRAIRCYERCGFRRVGRLSLSGGGRTYGPNQDIVLMVKVNKRRGERQ